MPFASLCAFSPEADDRNLSAVTFFGNWLVGFTARGTVREVYQFGLDLPFVSRGPAATRVVSRGSLLFAGAVFEADPGGVKGAKVVELVVLRVDGTVVFRRQVSLTSPDTSLSLAASSAGVFAFSLGYGKEAHTEVFTEDGFVFPPQDGIQLARPEVDPLGDGTTLVLGFDSARGLGDLYWLDVCMGRLREANVRSVPATSFTMRGPELLYADPASRELVRERGDGLGRTAIAPEVYPMLIHAPIGSPWAMVGGGEGKFVSLLTTEAAGSRNFGINLPPGQRYFSSDSRFESVTVSSSHRGLGVDSSGRLRVALRNNMLASLYVTEDGTKWEPVGRPVGKVSRVGFFADERSGTYVIRGDKLSPFETDDWAPAPPSSLRLDGDSVQVVRPSGGKLYPLPKPWSSGGFPISPDGGCVAQWIDRTTIAVLNVDTGIQRTIDLLHGSAAFGAPFVWTRELP